MIPLNRQIKDVLKKSGLSEKEIEIFIILNKKGPQKGTEIARLLKMNRGQVYRILKSLETKSFVEATLERPKMFIAVPLKGVIDSFIESKKEEVARIEISKRDLLTDWEKIGQDIKKSSSEKFSVIEGNKPILRKMVQMLERTKNCFSVALSVRQILRADQYGVFNPSILKSKSDPNLRILTQPSMHNLKATKMLHKELQHLESIKGLDTSLGTSKFSKMVIRDNDEIALFISKEDVNPKNEIILCTNSKSIVTAFLKVFEELWNQSRDISERITELENGKLPVNTQIIKDSAIALKKYNNILDSAKMEIFFVTSSEGLMSLNRENLRIKKWFEKGITIKIMSPITTENLNIAQELLEFCEVKHIPLGYLETTIVDGNHLFQFRPSRNTRKLIDTKFENTFYTNDFGYIRKTKKMIDDIWLKTHLPPNSKLDHDSFSFMTREKHISLKKCYQNSPLSLEYSQEGEITEKDVFEKFHQAKEKSCHNLEPNWSDKLIFIGNRAFASISPPDYFGLPDMILGVFQNFEASSFGSGNVLKVFVRQKRKKTFHYKQVANVEDNPEAIKYRKKILKDVLCEKNFTLVKKNQLIIKKYGTTLFAGWTIPIPLVPPKFVLPPSSILFEGYGEMKSGIFCLINHPSGRKQEGWYNTIDAFMTYFHPLSKYTGSGTEGYLDIDSVQIVHPPIANK